MAFLEESDKLKKEQDPMAQDPAQGTGQSTVNPPTMGAATNVVSSTPTGGTPTGAQTPWTNIQAYMNANQNDQGSANALNQKVGSQFEKEKTNLTTQANNTKSEAEKVAAGVSDVNSNLGSYLDTAQNAYQYGGAQSDPYKQSISKVQDAMNAQYSGPRQFDYGFEADTTRYGSALGNDDSFENYMNDIYRDQGGGSMSAGGRALQKQLDVNNTALKDMRQNLLNQYSELGGYRDQTVTDTTNALTAAEKQFRSNQSDLRDNLTKNQNDLQSTIDKLESDARYGYDQAYGSGSGNATAGYYQDRGVHDGPFVANRQRDGIWGDNLSYSQLQKEQDNYGRLIGGASLSEGELRRNRDSLNNFYSQQDAKYGNTADAEERRWNAIADILNSTGDRKQEGFKVRGT